ncbi:MAG: FIST signal transduction protein, partial [Gemmobacter sp.]
MAQRLIAVAGAAADDPEAPARVEAALGGGPFALVVLFVSPVCPIDRVVADLAARLAPCPVIGCTTAGEILEGYTEGRIVALGLPADRFAAETLFIPDLDDLSPAALIGKVARARARLADARPGWENDFAFLMVDGLSTREDALAATLAAGLGPVPLFGGSAADGTRFLETFVIADGRAWRNAAILALVRTECPVRVFSLDHLRPTGVRMVVTEADPARRIVRQINAEPAAVEYARLLGKDPAQLSPFTFAAHPVVVRIG